MKIKNVTYFLSAIVLGASMTLMGCKAGKAVRLDVAIPEKSLLATSDLEEDFVVKKYRKVKKIGQ